MLRTTKDLRRAYPTATPPKHAPHGPLGALNHVREARGWDGVATLHPRSQVEFVELVRGPVSGRQTFRTAPHPSVEKFHCFCRTEWARQGEREGLYCKRRKHLHAPLRGGHVQQFFAG